MHGPTCIFRANLKILTPCSPKLNTNIDLLRAHQAVDGAATHGGRPLEVEVMGVRVGDFCVRAPLDVRPPEFFFGA